MIQWVWLTPQLFLIKYIAEEPLPLLPFTHPVLPSDAASTPTEPPASTDIQGANISESVQFPSYHQLKTLTIRGMREEVRKPLLNLERTGNFINNTSTLRQTFDSFYLEHWKSAESPITLSTEAAARNTECGLAQKYFFLEKLQHCHLSSAVNLWKSYAHPATS